MNGVAAKIAQKICVLFEHKRCNARPRQQHAAREWLAYKERLRDDSDSERSSLSNSEQIRIARSAKNAAWAAAIAAIIAAICAAVAIVISLKGPSYLPDFFF